MSSAEIHAAVGTPFAVQLTAASSAGYRWEVKDLPADIRMEGHSVQSGSRPGDAASEVFEFRASKPGDYTLHFDYRRPWESSAVRSYEARVKVR